MSPQLQFVLNGVEVDFITAILGAVGVGTEEESGVLDALLKTKFAADHEVGLFDGVHQHDRPATGDDVHDALVAAAPLTCVCAPIVVGRNQEFFLRQSVTETALDGAR